MMHFTCSMNIWINVTAILIVSIVSTVFILLQRSESKKAKVKQEQEEKRRQEAIKLLDELKSKLDNLRERESLIRDRRRAIGISKKKEICIESLDKDLDLNYTKIKLLETMDLDSIQKREEDFLELIEKSVLNDHTLSVLDKEYLIQDHDLRLKIVDIISLPFQRKKPDLSIFFKK